MQNKIHYAIHGQTAAEVIYTRADAEKEFMGLTTFKGNQPTLKEAVVAKNYLSEKEYESIIEDCRELIKLTVSIVKTSKQNMNGTSK